MAKKKAKPDKNKDVIEGEVVENELLPTNPLLDSPVISEYDEQEQKIELMEQVDSITALNKQVLEAKQRETELIVDNRKLDAATKLIEGINIVADKALNPDTISKIIEKDDLTPLDLKLMAESMDKMSNTLKSLMRPSIQDEYGGRKRTKIVAQFQTQRGEKLSLGVDLDNDDD